MSVNPQYTSNRLARPGLILLLVLLLASACGRKTPGPSAPPPAEQPAAVSDTEAEDTTTRLRQRFQQGNDALALNDYAQARRIFSEIIRENPKFSGPYANLALIDMRQQKYDESLARIDRALELNPRNAQAYNLRAQLKQRRGDIKSARQDFEKAIELDPDYLNAHYNLALLYDIYLQEIELAIEHYSIYLSRQEKPDPILQDWINHLRSTLQNG